MGLSMMVKQFLIDTTKTAGQTQDVTDAAITSAPKAILFFATGPVGNHENGAAGHANRLIGLAADTTEGGGLKSFGLVARSAHNVTTTAENGYNDTANCLSTLTGSLNQPIDGRANVSSMLSNGFRLTVTEQFSLALSVMAVVFFGTDASNIECGTLATPTSGTVPFTADYGPAFACEDKKAVLFLLSSQEAVAGTQTVDSDLMFGMAVSAGEQACAVGAGDDALALPSPGTEVRRHLSNLQCFASFSGTKSSLTRRAAFDSWVAGGGFRLQWNAISAVSVLGLWLVIKGGQWSIKGGTCPAGGPTATVDVTGAGFDPIGGLLIGHGSTLQGASSHVASIQDSYGAFDTARSCGYASRNLTDQTTATVVAGRVEPDECYLEIGTDGSLTAAMHGAPITDGARFTVDSGDPDGHQFMTVLAGATDTGGGGSGPPVPDHITVVSTASHRASRW